MWLIHTFSLLFAGSTHSEPEFDVELPKLTVKLGSDASFTCIVKVKIYQKEIRIGYLTTPKISLSSSPHLHDYRFVTYVGGLVC